MTIITGNSPVHIYKGPLPTHEINEFHPQTITRVYSYYCIYFTTQKDVRVSVYKSLKRNVIYKHPQEKCSVNFCAKSKENFLLPKIYESKNVNVGIKTQHIFQSWKEDKSIDMDVLNIYKHLSMSICP